MQTSAVNIIEIQVSSYGEACTPVFRRAHHFARDEALVGLFLLQDVSATSNLAANHVWDTYLGSVLESILRNISAAMPFASPFASIAPLVLEGTTAFPFFFGWIGL